MCFVRNVVGNIANIEQDNDEEEAAEEKEKAKGIARSGSKDSAHSSRSGSFSELFSFNSDSDGNRQTHRDADTNRLSMMESAKQVWDSVSVIQCFYERA